jgi:hypothetical protein
MSDDSMAENRLREVLRDPRWALPTWPDPQDRVRRLARRQRVTTASLATAASAVVAAVIVVPLAVLGGGQGTSVPTIRPAAPAAPAARHNSPAVVVMPSTVGMSANAALAVLHSITVARITITVQDVQANQPPGTVVTQNPPAGSRVAPGSQINLTVSAAHSSP